MDLAKELYQDGVYEQLEQEIEADPDLVASDFGFDFNPFVRILQPYTAGAFVADTQRWVPCLTWRNHSRPSGFAHLKGEFLPQAHCHPSRLFRINDRTSLVTTAYASLEQEVDETGRRFHGSRCRSHLRWR